MKIITKPLRGAGRLVERYLTAFARAPFKVALFTAIPLLLVNCQTGFLFSPDYDEVRYFGNDRFAPVETPYDSKAGKPIKTIGAAMPSHCYERDISDWELLEAVGWKYRIDMRVDCALSHDMAIVDFKAKTIQPVKALQKGALYQETLKDVYIKDKGGQGYFDFDFNWEHIKRSKKYPYTRGTVYATSYASELAFRVQDPHSRAESGWGQLSQGHIPAEWVGDRDNSQMVLLPMLDAETAFTYRRVTWNERTWEERQRISKAGTRYRTKKIRSGLRVIEVTDYDIPVNQFSDLLEQGKFDEIGLKGLAPNRGHSIKAIDDLFKPYAVELDKSQLRKEFYNARQPLDLSGFEQLPPICGTQLCGVDAPFRYYVTRPVLSQWNSLLEYYWAFKEWAGV